MTMDASGNLSCGNVSAPKATLSNTTNQIVLGTTNTTTISATAPATSRTLTIPDSLANLNVILSNVNAGLTSASSRPAIGTSITAGEIHGVSSSGGTVDDGFLHLSAGGSTTAAFITCIDISGSSSVSGMDRSVVMWAGGVQLLRADVNGVQVLNSNMSLALNQLNFVSLSDNNHYIKYRSTE